MEAHKYGSLDKRNTDLTAVHMNATMNRSKSTGITAHLKSHLKASMR